MKSSLRKESKILHFPYQVLFVDSFEKLSDNRVICHHSAVIMKTHLQIYQLNVDIKFLSLFVTEYQ